MTIRIVRLGTKRSPDEGLRVGTVRYPPRGIPKTRYSADDWFDVWLPILAPSAETIRLARDDTGEHAWTAFAKRYRVEMASSDASRVLDLLAALSHTTSFSVGCYCEDESRCHRSLLRGLLRARGAALA